MKIDHGMSQTKLRFLTYHIAFWIYPNMPPNEIKPSPFVASIYPTMPIKFECNRCACSEVMEETISSFSTIPPDLSVCHPFILDDNLSDIFQINHFSHFRMESSGDTCWKASWTFGAAALDILIEAEPR